MKLNIGCGIYKAEGYLNIDKNPHVNPDAHYDVRKGLSGLILVEVEEIRAWHFLEHLTKDEIIDFFYDCQSVLSKDGKLDIKIPTGITYDLDHKSFLDRISFEIFLRGGIDDYYYGKRIAYELVKEERSKDERCEMLRLVLKKRL